MNFEKIRWWFKASSKIKHGEWFYPTIKSVFVFENQIVQGWNHPITHPCQKRTIKYNKKSCVSYSESGDEFRTCLSTTNETLKRLKNCGLTVTTLTFDQFYSFWSINPYRWHCRDLFAYIEDEENKRIFVQFKTKTDLRIYIGWREENREAYEKQALIEEHSRNTIALLKEVQRDINDTNDKAIEYYEQAVEYLGDDDNE